MRNGRLGLAFVILGACASAPAPRAEVASALAAVRGAEEVGARELPQAQLHLKLAEEQVSRARNLMEDGQNKDARRAAERAQQDAELALALARENEARRQLEQFASAHPQLSGAPEGGGSQGADSGEQ